MTVTAGLKLPEVDSTATHRQLMFVENLRRAILEWDEKYSPMVPLISFIAQLEPGTPAVAHVLSIICKNDSLTNDPLSLAAEIDRGAQELLRLADAVRLNSK